MSDTNQIDHEKLYDCLISLYEDIEKLPSRAKPENFKNFIESSKHDYQKITNIRTNVNHFDQASLRVQYRSTYDLKCRVPIDQAKPVGTEIAFTPESNTRYYPCPPNNYCCIHEEAKTVSHAKARKLVPKCYDSML